MSKRVCFDVQRMVAAESEAVLAMLKFSSPFSPFLSHYISLAQLIARRMMRNQVVREGYNDNIQIVRMSF